MRHRIALREKALGRDHEVVALIVLHDGREDALGLAVSVVVCPGSRLVNGAADKLMIGNCRTFNNAAFDVAGVRQIEFDTSAR